MKIAIATSREVEQLTADDRAVLRALGELGIEARPLVWTDPKSVQKAFTSGVVLIRTVWDYHLNIEDFCLWLDELVGAGVRVFNSPEAIRWNIDKKYLREFEKAKIPCVPSIFLGAEATLSEAQAAAKKAGWPQVVLKPTVSAGSFLTHRMQADSSDFERLMKDIQAHSDVMIQPYLEDIESRGEISLIFFNHQGCRFSHAVNKIPRKDDFRVQADFGGYEAPISPSEDLIEFSEKCLRRVQGEWIIARVDLLNWTSEPLLSEIELIEPDLYLRHHPHSVTNLAKFLSRALKR